MASKDGALPGTGSIDLILGPMFSGKTTELIRRTQRHELAGRRVVVIKYIKDTRYSAARCVTHDLFAATKVHTVLDYHETHTYTHIHTHTHT